MLSHTSVKPLEHYSWLLSYLDEHISSKQICTHVQPVLKDLLRYGSLEQVQNLSVLKDILVKS